MRRPRAYTCLLPALSSLILITSSARAADPKIEGSACKLFSATEVATFLKSPTAQIDDVNSGVNEFSHAELCNWYVKERDPTGLTFKIRRGKTVDDASLLLFSAATFDEEFSYTDGSPIKGLGDQSVYKAYSDGMGGTVVARKGKVVFTVTGSASHETLVEIAKQALARL